MCELSKVVGVEIGGLNVYRSSFGHLYSLASNDGGAI